MNRHIVAPLLSYSSTLERMLVRCSTWSRDGYRCLCACSLRPSVSASLCVRRPLPSLWNCKWMIFHQFIIAWSEEGVEPKSGCELGSYRGSKQKDIDMGRFTSVDLSACHVWDTHVALNLEFSGFKQLMQPNVKLNTAVHLDTILLWCQSFYKRGYLVAKRMAFVSVLADGCLCLSENKDEWTSQLYVLLVNTLLF